MKMVFKILLILFIMSGDTRPADKRIIYKATVSGPINPTVAEYIERTIDYANDKECEALIIIMDTPGGLDTSMRDIIKKIESSMVPIIVYIYPSGGRAASAGAIIALASHIAAMAPGTNIGAAHPVSMGGEKIDEEMKKKVVNDAVAYVKSIATRHKRNVDIAEKMVKESISLTADEAKKNSIVEFIAESIDELLKKIDGQKVKTAYGDRIIFTSGVDVETVGMQWRERILNVLSDPNIAYILMMIGIWGIFFELAHPGAIFPGVIGGICLLLGFYALQTLPVSYAGVLLILLGLAFFVAEIKITSYGLLSIAGIISIFLGSVMLIKSPLPFFRLSLKVITPTILVTVIFFGIIIYIAISAQLLKPTTGKEGLMGEKGEALTEIFQKGKVLVHGEYWDAVSETPIKAGSKVIVERVDGMKLIVKEVS